MFIIPRRSVRTSQPQYSIAIDWSKPITRGLKVVILPSLGWQAKDLARGLGYSAFSGGTTPAPVVIGSPGKAFRSNGYLYNQYLSIPSWANTNEGSALIIRSGDGGRLWELGDSGNSDEFPYGGLVYTDAFWSGRWANGVAPPSGKQFDVPLTLAVSVKEGRQVAFWDAEKWWSNNQSGGFTLPSSLQFGASAGGSSGGTHDTYLALAWDRALSDTELKSVSENPWQIFEDEEDYLFIPSIAGGGPNNITGTISATLDSIDTNFTLSAGHSGNLSASLQDISCTISATLGHTGTSAITLDAISASFSGTITSAGAINGTISFTLDDIVSSAAGVVGHSGIISAPLADVMVSIAGIVAGTPESITGTLAITLDGIGFIASGNSGTITLTQDDINAIKNAIMSDPKMLTIPKFLGLK